MKRVGTYVVLGSIGLAAIGCAVVPIEAVNRASREFSCPSERIAAVQRADIARNVYDLNACGTMVRYSCIWGEHTPAQCTREPSPATWDIDPGQALTIPRPLGVPADLRTPMVCDLQALNMCSPCLERDGASWRWHPCVSGPGPTGEHVLN
jgi:hypothetical protein